MARTRKRKIYEELVMDEIKEPIELSSAEVETDGPETVNGTVANTLKVNVRKAPSFQSEVVEILNKGDSVEILANMGEFYKVLTKANNIAYISSNYLKEG